MKRLFILILSITLIVLTAVPTTSFAANEKVAVETVSTVKLKKKKLTYNGKARNVSVVAVNNKGNKIPKSYYSIKYNKSKKNRKSYGKYSVTVTFKKPYKKTKTLEYCIVPKKQRAYVDSRKAKKIGFNIKKLADADGFQIQLCTDKSFPEKKRITVFAGKGVTFVEDLKPNKTYYYRTRSYKIVGKDKVYSGWSLKRKTSTTKASTTQTPADSSSKERIRKNANGKYELYVTEYTIWDQSKKKYVTHIINRWTTDDDLISEFLCESFDTEQGIPDKTTPQTYLKTLYETYKSVNLTGEETDYERFFVIARWFTDNYSYDHTYKHGNAYQLMKYKTAMCGGYAALFYDLCYLYKIDVRNVGGSHSGEAHAWNMLKLNGNWYQYEPQHDFYSRTPFNLPTECETFSDAVIQELKDAGYTDQQIYNMQHDDGVESYAKNLFLIENKSYKLDEDDYGAFWNSCKKGSVSTVRADLELIKTAYANATNHQFEN